MGGGQKRVGHARKAVVCGKGARHRDGSNTGWFGRMGLRLGRRSRGGDTRVAAGLAAGDREFAAMHKERNEGRGLVGNKKTQEAPAEEQPTGA